MVIVVVVVMMVVVVIDGDGKSSSCFDGTVLECKSIIQHCQLLIHIVQYEYWLLFNVIFVEISIGLSLYISCGQFN